MTYISSQDHSNHDEILSLIRNSPETDRFGLTRIDAQISEVVGDRFETGRVYLRILARANFGLHDARERAAELNGERARESGDVELFSTALPDETRDAMTFPEATAIVNTLGWIIDGWDTVGDPGTGFRVHLTKLRRIPR